MFATFGEITFELLVAPIAFESQYRWVYAEHKVVEARPRLQWISEALESISFDLRFHASFTDPASQLDALLEIANSHSAQALVLGNGDHQGYFVIESLRVNSTVMSAAGDIISMTLHMELKEWVLNSELDIAAAPQPNFTPIAIVPASEGQTTSTVTYSGASGVAETILSPSATYTATLTGAPGISSILSDAEPAGSPSEVLTPDDVPASTIVRSPV
jgi:phage protein U